MRDLPPIQWSGMMGVSLAWQMVHAALLRAQPEFLNAHFTSFHLHMLAHVWTHAHTPHALTMPEHFLPSEYTVSFLCFQAFAHAVPFAWNALFWPSLTAKLLFISRKPLPRHFLWSLIGHSPFWAHTQWVCFSWKPSWCTSRVRFRPVLPPPNKSEPGVQALHPLPPTTPPPPSPVLVFPFLP